MSKNVTELLASIPTRDESIRLALADIEQKLDAWSAAVGGCAPVPRDAGNGQFSTPANCAPSPEDISSTEPGAPAAIQVDVAESITVQAPDGAADKGPRQTGIIKGDESGYEESDDDSQDTPVARPASPDDDESVLVGLSSESAKAIKVQWRLQEGSKSLRQLVEEHKARLVRGDGSRDGKRSWWARGKG